MRAGSNEAEPVLTARRGIGGRLLAAEADVDFAVLQFYRIGPDRQGHRRPLGLSGRDVKTALVQGAFDDVVDDHAFRQGGLFVGAEITGGVEPTFDVVDGQI